MKTLFNAWFADDVGGSLFCGYSSATVYKGDGLRSGKTNYDFFGHIDISDTTPKQYNATWKWRALAKFAHSGECEK